MWKRAMVGMLMIAMGVSLAVPSLGAETGSSTFELSVTSSSITVDQDVVVTVSGEELPSFISYEVTLEIEASMPEAFVIEGPDSSLQGAGFDVVRMEGDRMVYAFALQGGVSAGAGDMDLCSFTVNAKEAGKLDIELVSVKLMDADLVETSYPVSSMVSVQAEGKTVEEEPGGEPGGTPGGQPGGNTGDGPGMTPGGNPDADETPAAGQRGEVDVVADTTVKEQAGRKIVSMMLDEDKVKQALANKGERPVVTVRASERADQVIGVLSGNTLQVLDEHGAALEISNELASYTLPSSQLKLADIQAQLGLGAGGDLQDLEVSVAIAASNEEEINRIEASVAKTGSMLIGAPIQFHITASAGGKTVEIHKFSTYVIRDIVLPEGVDPSQVSTGVVVSEDGTLTHIPTTMVEKDGKWVARMNSLTNSTYTLIRNPRAFADMEGHWAEQAVNSLASRMILQGTGANSFTPDRKMTRAEFAAVIVRALGLRASGGIDSYSDVRTTDWYYGAVETANEYGIVLGAGDRTFQPTQAITREEAAIMIVRALKLAGVEGGDNEAALSSFEDREDVSSWAVQPVAAAIEHGLLEGDGTGLHPLRLITRAEAAVLIQRFLTSAQLID